ncbi:nucleoside-diphosphate kinase [bacterium]|nr:nucleoside-diphosphate kinase [bacterium]
MERTLVLIKPDAVHRRLVGALLSRFEQKGLHMQGLKLMRITEALARQHYAAHEGKPFYEPLIRFMTGGPTVAFVLVGKGAIDIVRKMNGATFGPDAAPGTIRGDFGMSKRFNLVHASDSVESAEREVDLFFLPEELVEWTPWDIEQVYDFSEGEEPI